MSMTVVSFHYGVAMGGTDEMVQHGVVTGEYTALAVW